MGYFVDVRSGVFLWADNSNPVYDNWDESEPNSPVRITKVMFFILNLEQLCFDFLIISIILILLYINVSLMIL